MTIIHSIDFGFLLQPKVFHYTSVSSHVALFLFLSVVWLSRRCKEGRSKEKVENNNFLYHKLTLLSSLSVGLFCLLLSVSSYLLSNTDILFQLDLGVRTISWFLFYFYIQFEFGRLKEKRFPVLLRVWFPLFLIISLYSLILHILSLRNHEIVASHLWILDFGSVVAGLLLSYACFFGKRRNEGDDSLLQEPLLNGSCNSIDTGNRTSDGSKNDSLFTNAGFIDILTFYWIGPLLSLGHKKTLDLEDIPMVDGKDSTNGVLPIFKTQLDSQMGADGRVTPFKLAKALLFTCWGQVVLTAIYALVYNVSAYVGPYLIDYFVQYLNGTERSPKQGYLLVLAFVIGKVFECLSMRHWFFRSQQAGVRVQASLVGTIYQKGLTLSSQSRHSRTSGEMINIMSVDADRVRLFSWYMHDLWLVPVQIGLALTILYSCLGLASVSALAATILIMLANLPLSRMQENFEEKIMEAKDTRMKAMSEVLRNMRILKLQGWEMKFLQKIIGLRKNEASWIKKFMYADAGVTFLLWGTPTFVAVITFSTCMLMGIPLSSGKVLSALATFRVLQEPIYNLPETISMIIQTKVSLERISSFLCLEDLPNDVVHRAPKGISEVAVEVQNGTFSWDSGSEVLTLKNLNFRAVRGMKVAVCGTVGSGKSSLLSCILGEIPKISGEVNLHGSTAYVSQSPWIQSGKIQDNILFGMEMDTDRYNKVLEVCSLKKDLEILPHGDQTMIGERGINLSGGQKQRIQIARALYQDADIFLFDDPFSAVDVHTGSHLFKVNY
jgi:ABC-type multidrug transport system fused ATPase/permease subunit